MNRRTALILLASTALAACAPTPTPPALGPNGKPLPKLYRISDTDGRRLPFRALDAVNALRQASGAPPLTLDAKLTAAAETHSRDMSLQNRPWHFGSDGSSPIDRARRVGFDGRLLGEAISETYETELETSSRLVAGTRTAPRSAGSERTSHGIRLFPGIQRQNLVHAERRHLIDTKYSNRERGPAAPFFCQNSGM